jgi:hypothetical protein
MPFILKLVGCSIDKKYYEIINNFEGTINLKLFKDLFLGLGFELEDFNQIRIITNGEQLKDFDKCYEINEDITQIFLIFSSNTDIRKKLLDLFIEHGTLETAPIKNKPKETVIDEDETLNKEIIERMNKTTVELFNDLDFKYLLNIYIRKPELFSTFAQYVQSGNIVKENDENNEDYDESVEILRNLNLNISDNKLIKYLRKYSGHLNLTLRAILTETN